VLHGGWISAASSYSFNALSRTFVLRRAESQTSRKFPLCPQMKLNCCRFEVKGLNHGFPAEKPLCLITEQFGCSAAANGYRSKHSTMRSEIRAWKSPQLTCADEKLSGLGVGEQEKCLRPLGISDGFPGMLE